jgi:thioredoxin-related protein
MNKILIYLFPVLLAFSAQAQDKKPELIYQIYADAQQEVKDAVTRANAENKHVLLLIGGNWCKWCRMYEKFRLENARVDSASNANFVVVHVNFSKENKNDELMKSLDFPQRFGFPVFVVLDGKGKRLHTQHTGYLEDGEGYSEKKVVEFYDQWSKKALDPANYME